MTRPLTTALLVDIILGREKLVRLNFGIALDIMNLIIEDADAQKCTVSDVAREILANHYTGNCVPIPDLSTYYDPHSV